MTRTTMTTTSSRTMKDSKLSVGGVAKTPKSSHPLDPRGLYESLLRWAKVGCLSPLYSGSPGRDTAHRAYMGVVWTVTVLHVTSQFADIFANWGNISRMSQNLGFSSCIVNNMSRALIVFLQPVSFVKDPDLLLQIIFRLLTHTLKGIVRESNAFFRKELIVRGVAKFHIRHWERGAKLWIFLYASAGASIIAMVTVGALVVRLTSNGASDLLPAKAWYPFDARTTNGYLAAYSLQVAALPMVGVMLVVGDGLCVTVVALTCGQLELLRKEIRFIARVALDNVKSRGARTAALKDVKDAKDMEDVVAEVQLEKERLLKGCIATHQRILSFIALMENALSYVAFVNSWILTICLTTTAFEIMNVKDISTPRLVAIGVYLQTAVSFVLVYCFIGDKLVEEQEKIRSELYQTDWSDETEHYQYMMKFMLLRAQVPTKITVGKLGPLNLETYVKELNRAFTVFNAMVQLRSAD